MNWCGIQHYKQHEVMVSFDVESLFTNVPIDEALNIKTWLQHDTLPDRGLSNNQHHGWLAELCLRSAYFLFQRQHFQQVDGAAIGSPMSPIVANIFMEEFKELALCSAPIPQRLWKQYVDDTFCIINRTAVDSVLVSKQSTGLHSFHDWDGEVIAWTSHKLKSFTHF